MSKLVFLIVLVLSFITGCSTRPVIETKTVTDTMYLDDPYTVMSFFECDSNNKILIKSNEKLREQVADIWKDVVFSNTDVKNENKQKTKSKITPAKIIAKKTTTTTTKPDKPEIIYKEKIVKKVHPLTYVAFGVMILLLVLCIILSIKIKRYDFRPLNKRE